MKKQIFISLLILLTFTFNSYADIKHTVARGETVESIAKKYGVTTQQLLNANPDIAQFIYVGMELTIPGVDNELAKNAIPENNSISETDGFVQTNSANGYLTAQSKFTPIFQISIGSFGKLKEFNGIKTKKNLNLSMAITGGVRYAINEYFYSAAMLGYRFVSTSFHIDDYNQTIKLLKKYEQDNSRGLTRGHYVDGDYSKPDLETTTYEKISHLIILPVEIGGKYPITDNFSLGAYTGLEFGTSIITKTTYKNGSEKYNPKKEDSESFILGWNVGLNIDFGSFILRPNINLGLNKQYKSLFNKNPLFQVSFGCNF